MSNRNIRHKIAGGLLATLAMLSVPAVSSADADHGRVFDHRYHHDHYYPRRGAFVSVVPRAAVSVHFGGHPYYFHEGIWYRHYGPRFTVIAPPIGLVAPVLPPFYSTVWVRGIPYYYANDTYYVWEAQRRGYVVTRLPEDAEAITQPASAETSRINDQLFTYPKNGQSEQQQATDRFECHSWAANQTQYDPSQVDANASTNERQGKHADYTRAMTACLEGRGYSVK